MSLDDLQAQLRGALDQQFAALKQHYEQALTDVRREAAAEAERDVTARLQAARTEWESALAKIVENTRNETRQQAEEAFRAQRNALEHQLQQQLEQTVQHAMNSVKKTSELEIQALRRRVEEDVETERQRAQQELNAEREQAQQALAERERAHEEVSSERERLAQELAERDRAHDETHADRERLQQDLAERDRAHHATHAERERLEHELNGARAQAQRELEAERERAKAELETVQQLLEAEIASAQAEAASARAAAEEAAAALEGATARAIAADAAAADATAAAVAAAANAVPVAAAPVSVGSSVPASLARVPDALRTIDAAPSLSQSLEAWLQYIGAIAGRGALFLVNGDRLQAWKTVAIPEIDVQTVESSIGARDLLARAIQTGQSMTASADVPAPPFARLPAQRPAVAVPLLINGRAVAVVYADTGGAEAPAGWIDAIELVTRHASAVAGLRAAVRTLDVLRGDTSDPSIAADTASGNGNGEESARRYARLLVSEIKLYNEAAVRTGRQHRDLRQRLRSEIDRAQRLYEERVPPAVGAREQFFHQELVQTLADGDPALLGS